MSETTEERMAARKKAEEAASCDGGWPLHSSMAGRAAA